MVKGNSTQSSVAGSTGSAGALSAVQHLRVYWKVLDLLHGHPVDEHVFLSVDLSIKVRDENVQLILI